MKKAFTHPYTLLVLAMIVLASCSVQKRHYRPGFHIEAHKKPAVVQPKETKNETVDVIPAVVNEEAKTPTIEENTTASASTEVTPVEKTQPKEEAKTNHKAVKNLIPLKAPGSKDFKYEAKKSTKKGYSASPKGLTGGDKLIAILLCIFLGFIGVHRFYLGYIVSGIVYIALFIAAVVFFGWILGAIGWACGIILFALIIIDLIFLILDKPLIFQS